MTFAQENAMNRHGLKKHSTRNGFIICKAHDGWALVDEDGGTEFHIPSLAVARAEADAA